MSDPGSPAGAPHPADPATASPPRDDASSTADDESQDDEEDDLEPEADAPSSSGAPVLPPVAVGGDDDDDDADDSFNTVRLRSMLLTNISSLEAIARWVGALSPPPGAADEGEKKDGEEPLARFRAACWALFADTCKLEARATAHAVGGAAREDGGALDAALGDWAGECGVTLLVVQAVLGVEEAAAAAAAVAAKAKAAEKKDGEEGEEQALADGAARLALADKMPDPADLAYCTSKLEGFRSILAKFQKDHDEESDDEGENSPASAANNPVLILRRGLGAARDTLAGAKQRVDAWDAATEAASPGALAAQPAAARELGAAVGSLERYLACGGAAWLDGVLAGRLSFSEFRMLDLNRLRRAADGLDGWARLVEWGSEKDGVEPPKELFAAIRDELKMGALAE